MVRSKKRKFRRERLMPVLPNLFTTAGLFFGLLSIFFCIQGIELRAGGDVELAAVSKKFWWGAVFILISGLFDLIDGGIARYLKLETRFGFSYDSLCDLISFGVAPGVLVYCWTLIYGGKLGLMSVLFFIACTALRLARFNIQSTNIEKHIFMGLPSPASAGLMLTPVMLLANLAYEPNGLTTWFYLILAPFLGLLMVSEVRYAKVFKFLFKKSFNGLVVSTILIAAFVAEPEIMFLLLAYFYGISGLVAYIIHSFKKSSKESQAAEETAESQSEVNK